MQYIKADWPAPLQVKAYTTTRNSWDGITNPEQLSSLLRLPSEPVWIDQKHTTIAIEANPKNHFKLADAAYTNEFNRVCVVTTADCLPILLYHQEGHSVAAIHAGWRGLANGIIESTVKLLAQPCEHFIAWLGPAIGPSKFEVGKDVFDAFITKHPESQSAFIPHKESKWMANLYSLAKQRLQLQGISRIYGGNYCTYTQEELFFSYRRDGIKTGRMATVIWIENN